MKTGALPPVVRRSFPLALSALVVIGLGLAWWWHGRPALQPGGDAVLEDVALDVTASRPDARVTIRGVTYSLPLHTRLSRSKNAEMVEVSAPSCAPSRSWVTLDRDRGLDVVLASETRRVPPPRVVVQEPPPRHANPHAGRHASAPELPAAAPAPVRAVVREQTVVEQPVAAAVPIARPKPVLAAAPSVAQPMIVLQPQAMQRLVHAHQSAVDSCIAEDPSASGKLGYRVEVAPDGRVSSAQLVEAARRYPAIESCLVHALPQWTVAPAPGRPASGRVVIELD